MSALGHKRTCAAHSPMSALPPIATAKADIRKRPCQLYLQKRTCAAHAPMSAMGQKRTSGPIVAPLHSQACESFFPLFGRLRHALKKDGRAFYRHSLTRTVNLPTPRLSRLSSSLHGERIVGWIKFSTHHTPQRKCGGV